MNSLVQPKLDKYLYSRKKLQQFLALLLCKEMKWCQCETRYQNKTPCHAVTELSHAMMQLIFKMWLSPIFPVWCLIKMEPEGKRFLSTELESSESHTSVPND